MSARQEGSARVDGDGNHSAMSQFMMSSIVVVSSDGEDADTTTTSTVRTALRSRHVNQGDALTGGTAKRQKAVAGFQPRPAQLTPDNDSGRRRTSISFNGSTSAGSSSVVVSSDIDATGAGATTATTRRRHRPRQTSFVESDGRVTPLEPPPPPSAPMQVSATPASREPVGAALNRPQHPPLAPLHPGLPPAASVSPVSAMAKGDETNQTAGDATEPHSPAGAVPTAGPRVPRLLTASGSYSLRPDLTGVEAATPLPVGHSTTSAPHKHLPEDGPVAFNALQMNSLCQSGGDEDEDDEGGVHARRHAERRRGSRPVTPSREVNDTSERSPSLRSHVASHGAMVGALTNHRGDPCLFYEMGFCECPAHPPAADGQWQESRGAGGPFATASADKDAHTEVHLVGVASVVHQLLRDHQRLEQQCRVLEVRCNQQSILVQSLRTEVDQLRRATSSPFSLATVGHGVSTDDAATAPHTAHPPIPRRESMYVQRLRERTHSAQHLGDDAENGSGSSRRHTVPTSPPQTFADQATGTASTATATTASSSNRPGRVSPPALSLAATTSAPSTAHGKVLADTLRTPKSCGRGPRSASGARRSYSGGRASVGSAATVDHVECGKDSHAQSGTATHTSTHRSSFVSEESHGVVDNDASDVSPSMRAPHCFPSYRRDDSLSSISQPSSDLLGTAEEPEEADLLQRMMHNTESPLADALSSSSPRHTHTGWAGSHSKRQSAGTAVKGVREGRASPPSLSLISTTHRPAQFARAAGPLASPGGNDQATAPTDKCVPSPTRSPTITARETNFVGDDEYGDQMAQRSPLAAARLPTTVSPPLSPTRTRPRGLPSLSPVNTSLGAAALVMTKTAVMHRAPTVVAGHVPRTAAATSAVASTAHGDRHSTSYAAADVERVPRTTSAAGGKLSARSGMRAVCSQSNLKEFERQQRQAALEEQQRHYK